MRTAFLGTPSAAVPALGALADIADVMLVVTRPDRPKGRSGRPVPSAVKVAALEWGFRVEQPDTSAELHAILAPLRLDVAVVVAYGRILKAETLSASRVGFVNVHFSLLPRWRGAAPVERALLAGDPVTGVSLMRLDEGMDTGPVIAVMETPITDDETGGSLTARLSHLGARLLDDALPAYLVGGLQPAPQLDAGSTHAAMLRPDEAQITASTDVEVAERMVRAFHPRPGAWAMMDGDRIRILAARIAATPLEPGRVESVGGVPHLGLAEGALILDVVQPPGKRPIEGDAWMNGRRGRPGHLDAPGPTA